MFNFLKFLTDNQVTSRYKKAGSFFGVAVSMLHMGECVGFEKRLRRWEKWEAEYARRGYKPLSVDDFIHASYGNDISQKLHCLQPEGEEPRFHAKIYREKYLGKVKALINLGVDEVQFGYYVVPTTES
jgi:hypothetical protein